MESLEHAQKVSDLRRLCEVLSRREFSDSAIESMLYAVDDISTDDLRCAVDYLIQNNDFLPTIHEIREGIISGLYITPERIESDDEIDWRALIESEDRDEMGLDEEEYEIFKKEYEQENGEPYEPPGLIGLC